jgi:hypothetical protein
MDGGSAGTERPAARGAFGRGLIRLVVPLSLVLSILGGSHYYLGRRLLVDPAWSAPVSHLGWLLLVALSVSMPLSMVLQRVASGSRLARGLQGVALLWMGACGYGSPAR